jgi:hypothetical protein
MKCVVLQPSYIPWRGYFHQIQQADVFVFLDDVPYDRGGWRNRNRVKGPQGSTWLTVPVLKKGSVVEQRPINEIEINWKTDWARKHLRTIEQFYAAAPFLDDYLPLLAEFYAGRPELLAELTIELTVVLARALGITQTRFIRSSTLDVSGSKTARLLAILGELGATHYLSGPSAADYLEPDRFKQAGIQLEYINYDYPEYPQVHPPFDPQVSIVDLLLMTGPRASHYIWETTA